MSRRSCLLLGVALMLRLPSSALANPAELHGVGSRSVAMSGAVAADVAEPSAVHYNPSGLVFAERVLLTAGLQAVRPSLVLAGEDVDARPFEAMVLGLAAPGKLWGIPVAFGVAGHLVEGRLARIDTYDLDEQRWFRHQDQPEQVFIAAGLAIRPVPFLALGAGLGFLASTRAELSLRGTATQPGFLMQDEYDSRLSHEVVAELQSERQPILGVTVLPAEHWRLAAVFRGESRVALDVDSTFDGTVAVGPIPLAAHYSLESQTLQSFVPRRVVIGASHRPFSALTINVDVEWAQWSRYPSPRSATQSELELDAMGLFEVPELPEATRLESAQLRDRWVPRLGLEWTFRATSAIRVPVRLGYRYEPTPLAAGSSVNLVDLNRHVPSLGCGLALPGPTPLSGLLRLDLHAAWSEFVPRSVEAPDGGSSRASGGVLVFGATLGAEL